MGLLSFVEKVARVQDGVVALCNDENDHEKGFGFDVVTNNILS